MKPWIILKAKSSISTKRVANYQKEQTRQEDGQVYTALFVYNVVGTPNRKMRIAPEFN